jgi:hypothetical protein
VPESLDSHVGIAVAGRAQVLDDAAHHLPVRLGFDRMRHPLRQEGGRGRGGGIGEVAEGLPLASLRQLRRSDEGEGQTGRDGDAEKAGREGRGEPDESLSSECVFGRHRVPPDFSVGNCASE